MELESHLLSRNLENTKVTPILPHWLFSSRVEEKLVVCFFFFLWLFNREPRGIFILFFFLPIAFVLFSPACVSAALYEG